MSRLLALLFTPCLLGSLAAPTEIQAAAPPRAEVKTGLRVVATIFYGPAMPLSKGIELPAGRLAVRVFPEKGDKAVAEFKTDDKGVFVVTLPVGKYRVESVAFEENGPLRRQKESAKVEVKESAVSEVKLKFTYRTR